MKGVTVSAVPWLFYKVVTVHVTVALKLEPDSLPTLFTGSD